MDGHGNIQKNCGDQPLWRHWWSENVPAPDKEKVRVREQEIFHKMNVINNNSKYLTLPLFLH